MTDKDIRRIVLNALSGVAPELDEAALELDKSFRDQIDIDSMDFLNYVIALHDALAVDIPERDYPLLASIDGAVAYLSAQLKAAGKY
ncbi:MAG TPA: phosphopantetheine-binding protein [Stellaceae bacterium]|nr:phosphopantetheine-binding protein [Stellaceae bacterium]